MKSDHVSCKQLALIVWPSTGSKNPPVVSICLCTFWVGTYIEANTTLCCEFRIPRRSKFVVCTWNTKPHVLNTHSQNIAPSTFYCDCAILTRSSDGITILPRRNHSLDRIPSNLFNAIWHSSWFEIPFEADFFFQHGQKSGRNFLQAVIQHRGKA